MTWPVLPGLLLVAWQDVASTGDDQQDGSDDEDKVGPHTHPIT